MLDLDHSLGYKILSTLQVLLNGSIVLRTLKEYEHSTRTLRLHWTGLNIMLPRKWRTTIESLGYAHVSGHFAGWLAILARIPETEKTLVDMELQA